MTARELQLHQAGIAIGTAHGLEQAAKNLVELAGRVRDWPAANQAAMWMGQAAQNVEQLAVQRGGQGGPPAARNAVVLALREMGKRLLANQGELADWLEAAAGQHRHTAGQFRQQFAEMLAGVPPDTVHPIGVKKARPRAKTIGGRIAGKIVEGLRELGRDDDG